MGHLCVFAKHDYSEKEYIFAVPCHLTVRKGDILLVNTCKGRTIATATSEMFEGLNIDEIAEKFGAYLPLKEVVQNCGAEIQQYLKDKVVAEISAMLNAKAFERKYYELPF